MLFLTINRTQIDLGVVGFFSATMRRRDMIRRALDASMTVVNCTYLQNAQTMSEKFSRAVKSGRN